MGYQAEQAPTGGGVWALARRQHGVIARRQLLDVGIHPQAIKHRLAKGRLHYLRFSGHTLRGVYVVGRPDVTRKGRWMAAVLAAGEGAILSHKSAAELFGIRGPSRRAAAGEPEIELTVPTAAKSRPGLRVHRRPPLPAEDRGELDAIPVTSPARTLLDLATRVSPHELEAAVNEADRLDLIDPEALRAVVARRAGHRGVAALRAVLDRRTFRLTDSELERRFLRLARRAGLGAPVTGADVNGFKVDFFWPRLGLVVETDGLRYHRTPAQQARDRLRDQAHAAAGLTPVRFTHAQVRYEPGYVVATLGAVVRRMVATAA